MRLYHFLPAQHALDDLREQRLKLSEIENLNDPFELWCSEQPDQPMRSVLRSWKREMSKSYGLLCFSAGWENPLLWSHYADRHRGMCLAFDVSDEYARKVEYVETRTTLTLPFTEETMQRLLFTKFCGWSYEEEWRVWLRLEEKDQATSKFFRSFDEEIKLCEIILGPLCDVTADMLTKILQGHSHSVDATKARLAFNSFQVVRDQRGIR